MAHPSRSRGRPKTRARDRLIRLAARPPSWARGCQAEVGWSRLARPSLPTWIEPDGGRRLVEPTVAKAAPDPQALACSGWLVRPGPASHPPDQAPAAPVWRRFGAGRPGSAVTSAELAWGCRTLQAAGQAALRLVWATAPWHGSHPVRAWIRAHPAQVKRTARGVRSVAGWLPIQSPWLNASEATGAHGTRRVSEADGLLTIDQLADRVCSASGRPHEPHLGIPQKAA